MNSRSPVLPTVPSPRPWSILILLLSLLGIAVLTFFPFRFDFSRGLPGGASPFLLGSVFKNVSFLDCFLNVLLFVPFGFGLGLILRNRLRSGLATFFWVWAGGAACSYLVEFLQIYIPGRDSGWLDVVTNSTGAAVGFILLVVWGKVLLRHISRWEGIVEQWLLPPRIAGILIGYLVLCFAVSIPLQLKTRLSNWDPNAFLLIGGDASGHRLWKGKVSDIQIWDQSLSAKEARKLTTDGVPARTDPHLLLSYDFARTPASAAEKRFLPAFLSMPLGSPFRSSSPLDLHGDSWLASSRPASDLVRKIKETDQFSLRLVCTPVQVGGVNGHIISIGDDPNVVDLSIRQERSTLFIWVRTPLYTGSNGYQAWTVPHVFVANRQAKIIVSYDGSYGSAYVDGVAARSYRLSPGTSLAQMLHETDTRQLDGYLAVYDALIFVPVGLLLGMGTRKVRIRGIPRRFLLLMSGIVLPSVCFELLLVWLTGRGVSLGHLGLCLSLTLLGLLLITADDRRYRCNSSMIIDTETC